MWRERGGSRELREITTIHLAPCVSLGTKLRHDTRCVAKNACAVLQLRLGGFPATRQSRVEESTCVGSSREDGDRHDGIARMFALRAGLARGSAVFFVELPEPSPNVAAQ